MKQIAANTDSIVAGTVIMLYNLPGRCCYHDDSLLTAVE
jgi:hypothetical protein